MPDETIYQLTERLSRTLTMTQPTGTTAGLTELQREQIALMIRDALKSLADHLADEGIDHPIGTTTTRLEELDRVPDIVRSLREFSGKPGEFNSWRKAVERVLGLYDSVKGTGRYYAILHTIRTKIIGDADTALESYRAPLDWIRIKRCLSMHYSDKRDIGTLEYQMTTLCQGNRTITEFYQGVYQHLSLLLDKVSCLDLEENSLHAMTTTYREKALDTFIRGLNGDLPRLLSVREPTSLPQALHICLKLDNMNFRRNYAHGYSGRGNVQKDRTGAAGFTYGRKFYPKLAYVGGTSYIRPPVQPRYNLAPNFSGNPGFQPRFNPNYIRSPNYGYNSNPQPISNPNYSGNLNYSNYLNPPKNAGLNAGIQNRPQNNRVEPMDVDKSIQTRHVNYINRPQRNPALKRPTAASFQVPANKFQRNFHIETDYIPVEAYYCGYPPEEGEVDHYPESMEPRTVQEYLQQIPEEAATLGGHEDEPDEVQQKSNFLA